MLYSSLLKEIFTRSFWPGLVGRGCPLNLLPSCHPELSFIHLLRAFFLFPIFSCVESPVSWNPHMCLSWFISSFVLYILGDHTFQLPPKTRVWKYQNKGLRHCGFENISILYIHSTSMLIQQLGTVLLSSSFQSYLTSENSDGVPVFNFF